jgi:hypothetical protein
VLELGLTLEFAGGAPLRRISLVGHAAEVAALEAFGDGDGRCGPGAGNAIDHDVVMRPEANDPLRTGSPPDRDHLGTQGEGPPSAAGGPQQAEVDGDPEQ